MSRKCLDVHTTPFEVRVAGTLDCGGEKRRRLRHLSQAGLPRQPTPVASPSGIWQYPPCRKSHVNARLFVGTPDALISSKSGGCLSETHQTFHGKGPWVPPGCTMAANGQYPIAVSCSKSQELEKTGLERDTPCAKPYAAIRRAVRLLG